MKKLLLALTAMTLLSLPVLAGEACKKCSGADKAAACTCKEGCDKDKAACTKDGKECKDKDAKSCPDAAKKK